MLAHLELERCRGLRPAGAAKRRPLRLQRGCSFLPQPSSLDLSRVHPTSDLPAVGCLARGQGGLSMLTSERRNGLDRNGGPLARAETGGPGTGPRPAAPRPTEPSGPIGGARPSHCIHPDLPRGGNAAVQLNWVASERATSRMNSAAAYSKANVDFSAMAAGRHGDHEPVSVELGRICGRSGTDDCESGRQSEGAHTNANHGSPHTSFYLRGRFAQRARNVLMEQCDEFQAHLAPQRMHALWRSSNIRSG